MRKQLWIGDHAKLESFYKDFWQAIAAQDAASITDFFTPDAKVRWHCTNECFTAAEFVLATCEYPGNWKAEMERVHAFEDQDLIITTTRVWLEDDSASFHVTSYFQMQCDKIASLDEYWGDDGMAPKWRQELQIGTPLK